MIKAVKQMPLEFTGEAPIDETGGLLGFTDPAFATNKVRPIHRWVPWIAGFSSEFVRDAVSRLVPEGGKVLDPFGGVGTTLVEAQMMGHSVLGVEINPYAALACRVKTSAFWLDIDNVKKAKKKLIHTYERLENKSGNPKTLPPPGFKTRGEFYSKAVLKKVLYVQDAIATVEDEGIRDLFRLAFASTMVMYSNYSYEPSLGRRRSSGKSDIEDFPVIMAISAKLEQMADDIAWLQSRTGAKLKRAKVVLGSIFTYGEKMEANSVDGIVTSPPYLNNYHYNRNTRPQVYWLGYANGPGDMKELELGNFGKYWQTVREADCIPLDFKLPNSDLQNCIDSIAGRNGNKGVYGGRGWANYAATYFNDSNRLAAVMRRVLKRGGMAAVVIGNSIIQGVHVATDKYFAEVCELNGLKLVGIQVPRLERVGSSIIKSSVRVDKASSKDRLYESVVVLQKR